MQHLVLRPMTEYDRMGFEGASPFAHVHSHPHQMIIVDGHRLSSLIIDNCCGVEECCYDIEYLEGNIIKGMDPFGETIEVTYEIAEAWQ